MKNRHCEEFDDLVKIAEGFRSMTQDKFLSKNEIDRLLPQVISDRFPNKDMIWNLLVAYGLITPDEVQQKVKFTTDPAEILANINRVYTVYLTEINEKVLAINTERENVKTYYSNLIASVKSRLDETKNQ